MILRLCGERQTVNPATTDLPPDLARNLPVTLRTMKTKLRKYSPSAWPAVALLLGAWAASCPRAAAQAAPSGAPRELEPPPRSEAFPGKEAFRAAEYVEPAPDALPPNARPVRLRMGAIQEVFTGDATPGDGLAEKAFYLPPEAAEVVQLVVEKHGWRRTYFLKAVGPGDTVGGVVERRWLDGSGFRAKDSAHEARIQAAVQAEPYLISVIEP